MNTLGKRLYADIINTENPSGEPALKVGAATGVIGGLVTLILYFFPSIPDNVIQGVLVVSAVLLPIITAAITRGRVWSPEAVFEVIEVATENAIKVLETTKPKLLKTPTPMSDEDVAAFKDSDK